MTEATRINARVPPEIARKLAYLERRMGLSTTEVVLKSIDCCYSKVTDETTSPASILARVGFLGCHEGPSDLSETYKDAFAGSLGDKT